MEKHIDTPELIDEEILSELLTMVGDGGSEGLAQAFELFLTHVPERLAAIEEALAQGRLETAARVAHSLRGSAATFGARRLSELAARQEELCGAGDGVAAAALVEPLHAQFATVEAILRSRLARPAAWRPAPPPGGEVRRRPGPGPGRPGCAPASPGG